MLQIGDARDVREVVVGREHGRIVGDGVGGDEDVDCTGGADEACVPERRLDVEDEGLVGSCSSGKPSEICSRYRACSSGVRAL